ncbi:serine/threonine protein kinase, partial [Candidatus Parcubacteria bacterium]
MSAQYNLEGQSIGRYHILEQVGQGGMATVYKAYDTRLERDVALKVIRRGAFPPDDLDRILKRFEREAKSLARLSHPHIVKVLEYGEHEGSPYLVLEYLAGGTLKEQLTRQIPWDEAAALLLPIARALHYAHQQGFIHRDIKPANILLTAEGQPLLSDFGIAKLLTHEETQTLTGTGVSVGTPEYMSPEQGLGGEADARSDVYALGIVFYEMLTGRKPFQGETPMAVVVKHINEPLPKPSHHVRGL